MKIFCIPDFEALVLYYIVSSILPYFREIMSIAASHVKRQLWDRLLRTGYILVKDGKRYLMRKLSYSESGGIFGPSGKTFNPSLVSRYFGAAKYGLGPRALCQAPVQCVRMLVTDLARIRSHHCQCGLQRRECPE